MKKGTLIILMMVPILSFSQASTEIFLLDMQVKGKTVTLSNPVNISNHKGYDNQPFFSPKEPILYFTSERDTANTEIKTYNYKTQSLSFLTNTLDNEYSPTVTPDGKFISCIIARKSPFAQDLGKYPVNGGEPVILINNLVVGYHAWIDDSKLLLFVLDGNGRTSLHHYNLLNKEDKVIAQNPGRSLRKIPGENAMSYVDKTDSLSWKIKRLDLATMQISDIAPTLLRKEDMTWTSTGIIIMSNGTDLFSLQPGSSEGWQKINIANNGSSIQGITRLAVNADNSKLAIVVRE